MAKKEEQKIQVQIPIDLQMNMMYEELKRGLIDAQIKINALGTVMAAKGLMVNTKELQTEIDNIRYSKDIKDAINELDKMKKANEEALKTFTLLQKLMEDKATKEDKEELGKIFKEVDSDRIDPVVYKKLKEENII